MLIQGFSQYTYLVTRIDDHSKNFCAGVTSSLCCGTLIVGDLVIALQNTAHARAENFGGLLALLLCCGTFTNLPLEVVDLCYVDAIL